MSWFYFFKGKSRQDHGLTALHGDGLNEAKTRTEIEKLRVEILDTGAWPAKLVLSLILPLLGAAAFFKTWYDDRSTASAQRDTQRYADAAQQLSSDNPSVRLSAVHILNSFIQERSWFARHLAPNKNKCGQDYDGRARQAVTLIIGLLPSEQDASVLDEISSVASDHPCLTSNPLLSVNRSAAVQFSRAAGTFGGLYILREQKTTSLSSKDNRYLALHSQIITAISIITQRTGSPFEVKDKSKQTFDSAVFFNDISPASYPFVQLFDKQFKLTLSSDLELPLIATPPSEQDLQTSLQTLEDDASVLEKVSYVLARLVGSTGGLAQIESDSTQKDPLYGTAIVAGELDPPTVKNVRDLGAYVYSQQTMGSAPAPPLKTSPNSN